METFSLSPMNNKMLLNFWRVDKKRLRKRGHEGKHPLAQNGSLVLKENTGELIFAQNTFSWLRYVCCYCYDL